MQLGPRSLTLLILITGRNAALEAAPDTVVSITLELRSPKS